ncbi:MAG: hypothetical protein IPQ24_19860 [Anaeromyxobacter sp.]|nr:hypothetical protein [Anaeromyxobacter sp.]
MSLRRAGLLAVPLALAACTEVTQQPLPADLVFARYSSPNVPTPNDLALAAVPAAPCAFLPNAQAQLLCTFKNAGGFPSDQEVSISIPFTASSWDPARGDNGEYVAVAAPAIDLTTVTADTVAVLRVDVSPVEVVETEAASAAGACSAPGTCTPATLTLRKKADATGSRRWAPGGRYVIGVRGGPNGVKTSTGQVVNADTAIALAIMNRDLTKKENQPLGAIPDSNGNGTNADEVASLEGLRQALWNPLRWSGASGVWIPAADPGVTAAFPAIDGRFPLGETASLATFGVAPSAGTVVLIDSGSGVAPLPIDLLRTDADGTVIFNPAFGPAAAGLDTLDGFSTSAMMLAQTSATLDASTVTAANVFLYKLGGAAPQRLLDLPSALGAGTPAAAAYLTQPPPIVVTQAQGCPIAGGCSSIIGLQPAVTAPVPGLGTFYLPPLDEGTTYAVVVTNRVKDVAGGALVRPTVAKILLEFTAPLAVGGVSAIPGVANGTAAMLQTMRAALDPIWAVLPAGTTKADVVTAYTFKTQSITGLSLQLSAAPYLIESRAGPGGTPAAVFAVTSVTPGTSPLPAPNVAGFFDVTFNSLDAIDKTTGTLRRTLAADLANPAALLTSLHALVATPLPANVPACLPPFPAGTSCAKVVVVGHGLGGSKETLYALADALAARGFIAVATDFPLHGARAWCKASAECGAGGVCTPFAGGAGQGDATPPGTCSAGAPVSQISGQFFISANFFRIRDAFRQNLIDQSALALAMARPPAGLAPQPAQDARAALGLPANVLIDPSAVRWEGVSLGAIAGTGVLATNPRFDRGALAVGGAMLVDLFTDQASTFAPQVDAVFAGIGIPRDQIATNPAVAAAYLRTVNVAKWIVDPADPGNFAKHVSRSPLPNLLASPDGSVPQAAKGTFAIIAKGDPAIRNPYNQLLANLTGSSTFVYQGPGGIDLPHSFIGTSAPTQADAASYLFDATLPAASPVTLP